ncbi:MAG: hypothetical protein GKR89_18975 [Candidatus Latescibacteria bacterium]|nr:hypothetical protein [Candidatus Latescibacterota bacterium]
MLTEDQQREFDELGILRLPGAVDPQDARILGKGVWEPMEAKGMRCDEPETWRQVTGKFFRKTRETGAFKAMASPVVRQGLDGLFGARPWEEPEYWGGPLVTFPNTEEWEIPRGGWHLDGRAGNAADAFNRVAVFVFLDRVEPGGGGTLVAAGTHKLVRDLIEQQPPQGTWNSAEVRKALLRAEPWFRELLAKGEAPDRHENLTRPTTSSQGHRLQVIECSGEPGDVFMTHPWLFHCGARNARAVPRLMLLQFVDEKRDVVPAEIGD